MKITVKYFAFFKEKTGVNQEYIEMCNGKTITELLKIIIEKYNLQDKENIILSLNQEYVKGDVPLHDGDEVALMVPSSGG
ncbi:MAG: molybdopterin synthase small subunit [Candidatus Methanofastidiosum methylothiophilum]|uniref:Molybdopterin synthase small subunit n=1 Tax=Candidatus Methanofastidiosum methylothiophilum TaxID=1705564 RepID=A0A150J6W8_9EURY|nr:MAG: molybdopterin synthase small subunit [Candidatus Methanofastidiosum methylthiophilus]